jgi:hypothetical protein
MMGDQFRADVAIVDASVTQLAADDTPANPLDAGGSMFALAASFGVAANAISARDPSWQAKPDDWRKEKRRHRTSFNR